MSGGLLCGYGGAFVDIVITVSDEELRECAPGVPKGTVCRLEAAAQQSLLARFAGERQIMAAGGSCANTLRSYARQGGAARLIAAVGSDEAASFFAAAMERDGVELWPLQVHGAATDCCVALVTPDGERTMFPVLSAGSAVKPQQLSARMLEEAQWLHVEGYALRYLPVWTRCLELCAAQKIPYSADAADCSIATPHRARLLRPETEAPQFRWLFANAAEAHCLCPAGEWPADRPAVVTAGAGGATGYSRGIRVHCAAMPLERVVDSVGAGDNFIGGFLREWLRFSGSSEEERLAAALRTGCRQAAQCLQRAGA